MAWWSGSTEPYGTGPPLGPTAYYAPPAMPAYQAMPGMASPPPTATVGQVFDLYNRLSEADKAVFKQLLAGGQAETPAGMTRDPTTGRVYKIQQAMPVSQSKAAVENALGEAARALKAHGLDNHIVVEGGRTVFPKDTPSDVRASHEVLVAAHNAAKAARDAHKASHPTEWGPSQRGGKRGRGAAPTSGRGGRGRGIASGSGGT
jgi:hypothetical protein